MEATIRFKQDTQKKQNGNETEIKQKQKLNSFFLCQRLRAEYIWNKNNPKLYQSYFSFKAHVICITINASVNM